MNEMPLSRAVHLGLNRINQWETIFSPDETSLLIDFRMSSGLSGVAALLPEDGSSSTGYDLVKWSAAETPTLDVTLDDLWACTKEHYGLTAITAVAGIGGVPISKLRLGRRVQPGSSIYTNLVSHYGLKFFPMARLPHGSTAARVAKSTFGTIRVFGIIGRALPFVAVGLPSTTSSASECAPMKNETENNASALPTKEQVIETVIDIFVREIGFIEREEVSRTTNVTKDFYIYTDDLSIFADAVVKHFDIDSPPEEWSSVGSTIEGIADFVLRHLSKKQ